MRERPYLCALARAIQGAGAALEAAADDDPALFSVASVGAYDAFGPVRRGSRPRPRWHPAPQAVTAARHWLRGLFGLMERRGIERDSRRDFAARACAKAAANILGEPDAR